MSRNFNVVFIVIVLVTFFGGALAFTGHKKRLDTNAELVKCQEKYVRGSLEQQKCISSVIEKQNR